MKSRLSIRRGFTLVELLIVLVLLGIVVAMVLPRAEPQVADLLTSAGQILASDLEYARQLAIANNTRYKVVFRTASAEYYIQHSGSNSAFDVLPRHPYLEDRKDSANKPLQLARLALLPSIGSSVELYAVEKIGTSGNVTELEFDSSGQTLATENTRIWLAAGRDSARRYLPITVTAATGIVSIGDVTDQSPTRIMFSNLLGIAPAESRE